MGEWTPLIAAHAAGAALALVLGAFNLVRKPRGDRLHRMIGYAWVGLMYWVAVSSFWIQEIDPGRFSWIHLLSVLTLVTLSLGLYFAVTRKIRQHLAFMGGTYLGLVGAFVGVVAVPSRLVPQLAVHEPGAFFGVVAILAGVAGGLVLASRRFAGTGRTLLKAMLVEPLDQT